MAWERKTLACHPSVCQSVPFWKQGLGRGGAGLGSGQSGPPGAAVLGPLPKGKHALQSFSGRGCEALLQGKTPPDSLGPLSESWS